MTLQSAVITVMVRAARKAARDLRRDFGEVENLQVSRKGPADFVSQADLKADRTLREELRRARPDYGFLTEEAAAEPGSDPQQRRWIVDPLDGTTNFLHGLPHFSISLALEERGDLVAAVVYDPIKDEMFIAERGNGAYLNDRRLRVSGRQRLEEALFATGIPFLGTKDHEGFLQELRQVMGQTAGVRRWGSAALDLAYVAAGRFDGFWERDLSPWDIAAGALLVREAGGVVSQIGGATFKVDSKSILAVNPTLHTALDRLLKVR